METRPATERGERWSSQMGFLAAAIGSAVGLGNIWRFPYLAGANGGGTFLIPYVVAIVTCGIPLMMFEMAAGREYRRGIVGALQSIRPGLWTVGAVVAIIGFAILSYYLVVTGWTLGYSIITPLGWDSSFSNFTDSWQPVVYFLVTTGVCFTIVLLGVNRGIEATAKVMMPLLVAIVLLLAGYGLTLDGAGEALSFLLRFEVSRLLEPRAWADAFGQAFFSLGVGMGVLLTYGSYMDRRGNVALSSGVVTGVDTMVALVGGLAVFPIVFSFGYSPAAGPQLAFETLPSIFKVMHLGTLVGTGFYLLLFIAAISSAVSLLEMAVAALMDRLGWSRARSAWAVLVPLLGLGALSALSYSPASLRFLGRPVLDVIDSAMGTFGLLLGGLLTAAVLFWQGRPQVLARQLGLGPRWLATATLTLGRYMVPAALAGTLVAYGLSL